MGTGGIWRAIIEGRLGGREAAELLTRILDEHRALPYPDGEWVEDSPALREWIRRLARGEVSLFDGLP